MRRRSRLEIIIQTLQIIEAGSSSPTRIMYASNSSWNPTMKLLGFMVDSGYILMVNGPPGRRFSITEKGQKVARYLVQAQKLIA
ncbi:unnamed protein product [marine sediment metagenome]|uniref:ArnR1-like winged helix-turn-helix domain-containing protein n=1 Tax=marine sediment metagenome TaxID=412755 RepID=X1NEJ8_9ZZZZ